MAHQSLLVLTIQIEFIAIHTWRPAARLAQRKKSVLCGGICMSDTSPSFYGGPNVAVSGDGTSGKSCMARALVWRMTLYGADLYGARFTVVLRRFW